MWPLNECVFYVQIQAAKPVYSDSSLDKLWWSCSARPIECLETSYGNLDLYMKYTFSWEATSPLSDFFLYSVQVIVIHSPFHNSIV